MTLTVICMVTYILCWKDKASSPSIMSTKSLRNIKSLMSIITKWYCKFTMKSLHFVLDSMYVLLYTIWNWFTYKKMYNIINLTKLFSYFHNGFLYLFLSCLLSTWFFQVINGFFYTKITWILWKQVISNAM